MCFFALLWSLGLLCFLLLLGLLGLLCLFIVTWSLGLLGCVCLCRSDTEQSYDAD